MLFPNNGTDTPANNTIIPLENTIVPSNDNILTFDHGIIPAGMYSNNMIPLGPNAILLDLDIVLFDRNT
jgi:hypothetical protein